MGAATHDAEELFVAGGLDQLIDRPGDFSLTDRETYSAVKTGFVGRCFADPRCASAAVPQQYRPSGRGPVCGSGDVVQ